MRFSKTRKLFLLQIDLDAIIRHAFEPLIPGYSSCIQKYVLIYYECNFDLLKKKRICLYLWTMSNNCVSFFNINICFNIRSQC